MRTRRAVIILTLVVLLPVGYMYQTLLLGRPLGRDDSSVMVYPLFHALDAALARGDLYLWDQQQWCGLPALAGGETTGLYPPTLLLFGLLPWMTALHLSYWLHLAVAVASCFWVARNLGASYGPAVVAGVAYAFSGYQAAHLMHFDHITALAHLPLMLALLQTALARGRGWWALLALEIAAALLSSHPMLFTMAATVSLLWLLLGHDWRHAPGRWRALLPLGATLAAGVLLAMPQLLPMAALAAEQGKVETADEAAATRYMAAYPFEARDLARVLLPNVLGTVHANIMGGGPEWHETQPFTGTGPLLLGIAGLIIAFRRRGWGFGLATLLVGAALMPAEGNPIHTALAHLPFWGSFRATGRWVVLPIFALAQLSALALTWLPEAGARVRAVAGRLIALLALVIVGATILLWMTFGVDDAGRLVLPGTGQPVTVTVPADAVFNCVTSVEPLLLIGAALLTAVVVMYLAGGQRPGALVIGALLLAIAAPQWHLWQITNVTVPRSFYLDPPAVISALDGRITILPAAVVAPDWRPPQGTREQRMMDWRERLVPALGTIWGAHYAEGYKQGLVTPATLKLWEAYFHYGAQAFTGVANVSPETLALYGTPTERMKRTHRLAAIQQIVTVGQIDDPDLERRRVGEVNVYTYRQPRSRWWLARRAIVAAAAEAQLHETRLRDFDPDEDVVVDRPVALGEDDPEAEMGSVQPAPGERLRLRVSCPAPRVLVVADSWYPGWRATVDAQPTEILRANYAFRGVVVPAGEHTVEFRFRPASWPVALPLCGLGALLALAVGLWPRRTSPPPAPAEPPAPLLGAAGGPLGPSGAAREGETAETLSRRHAVADAAGHTAGEELRRKPRYAEPAP